VHLRAPLIASSASAISKARIRSAAIGEVGVGLGIILSGQVDVYRYDASGTRTTFSAAGSMRSNARPAGEAFAGVRLPGRALRPGCRKH
jgi:hypothetical protein